jgi:hypothetical protein
MRERLSIAGGLALFIILATTPFWRTLSSARALPFYSGTKASASSNAPDLAIPASAKNCVAPLDYMRKSHMQLLISWRDDVVRRNDREYHSFDGKVYEKSLTRTCLGCHNNRAQFCDSCHTYSGVSGPYCWDCHNQPQVTIARSRP